MNFEVRAARLTRPGSEKLSIVVLPAGATQAQLNDIYPFGDQNIEVAHIEPFLYPAFGIENVAYIWAKAVREAALYLGSIRIDHVRIIFHDKVHGLTPGHKQSEASMLLQVSEGEKTRVMLWGLQAHRTVDGVKSDDFFLCGTKSRPFGAELAREIVKRF